MRGLLLLLSHLFSIRLLSLLLLSTQLLWAQGTSAPEKDTAPLPDAPSTVQTHLHLTYKGFPLIFMQNKGQAEPWMKFFLDHGGNDRLSANLNAVSSQGTTAIQFWEPNRYFISSAPAKWTTFALAFGHLHHEAADRIPWASPVILRISQQAKAHPHITTVLKTVHPRF